MPTITTVQSSASAPSQTVEGILLENESKRTKCIVYTRVMGYHRPVESFNHGKLGEHIERAKFVEPNQCIAQFNAEQLPSKTKLASAL